MMSSATATQTQMNAASTPPMGSWQQQSMQTQSSNQQMVSMQPPTYFLPPGMAAGLMSMPQQQQQQPPPPPPPAPHHHHHFQPHPFGTMMARAPVVYSMMSSGGGVPNGGNTFTQVQMEGFMHAAQGTPSWMPPTLPMHPNRLSHGGNAPPTVVVGFQNQQGQAAGTPTTTATTPGNNTGASMRSPPLRPNGPPPMMLVSSAGSGISPPSVSPSHGSPSFPAIPVSYGIPIPQPLNSFDSNHRRMGNSSGDSDSSRNSRREAAVKKHSLLKSRGELNTAKTGGQQQQQQQQQQQVSGDHLFLASSNNASVSSSRNAVSPSVGFMGSSFALCNASAASGCETDGGGGGLVRLHDGDTREGPSRRRLAIPVLVPDGDGLETTSSVTPASSPHRRSIMNLDEHRVAQRQKQIRFGKVTKGYLHYRLAVPTFDREVGNEDHPETPHATSECSKRKWDSHVAQWRRKLHVWDTMTSDDAPLQLSKGLPRRQDLGLERPTSRIEYYARTYAEIDRVKDEVTTMYQHGHDSDAIASEVPAETAGSQMLGGRTAPAQHQAGSYSDTHPSTPGLTTTTTTTPGNSLAWAAAPMHDQQQQQQHGGGRGGGISSSALPLLRLPESVPIDGSTSGLVVAPLQPTTMMGEHDMMSMVAPQHSSDSLAWQEGVMSAMMAQSLPPSKVEAIFANEDAHVADVTKEFVGGEGDTEVDGDSVHAVTQLPTMLPPSQSTTPSQGGAISGTNISNTQFEFSVLDEFRGKGGRVPPTPLSPMGCHESPIRPGGQRPPTGGGHSLNRSNFPVFSGALEQTLTPPSSSALGLLAASSRTPDDKLLNRPSSGRSWQRPSEGGSSGGGASAKKALRSPPRPRSSNSASGVFGSGMSLVNRTLSSPLSTALDQQQHSPLAAFADGTTTQSLLDSPQQSILREGRQFMIVYLDGSVSNSSQPDRKERVGSAGKHRGNGGGQQPSSAFSQQQTDVSPCESCVVPATTTAAPRTSPGVDVSPASATTTPSSFERGRDTLVVARPSELIKCLQQAHFDLDKMTFVDPPSAIQLHLPVSPGMLIAPGVSERPLSTIEDVSKWLEVYRDVPIPFMFYRDRIPSFKDTPMLWMSEDNMNASNGGDMLILQNPPSATKQRANNAAHRARDNSLITSAIAMQSSFAYCANNNSSLAFVNGSNASMTALHMTAGGGGSGPRTTTPHHLTLGGMVDEGMMLTFYPSQATMTMSPIACLDAAKLTAGSFYSVPPSQLAMGGGGGGGTFEFASSTAATASVGGMRLDATPTTATSAVAAGASLTSLTTHSSPVVVLDGSASPEGSHHSTTHSSRRRTSSPGLLDATLNGDIIPSPSAKSRHVNESGSHFGGGDTLWM